VLGFFCMGRRDSVELTNFFRFFALRVCSNEEASDP
jgi:hypothetical protein